MTDARQYLEDYARRTPGPAWTRLGEFPEEVAKYWWEPVGELHPFAAALIALLLADGADPETITVDRCNEAMRETLLKRREWEAEDQATAELSR